MVNQLKSTEIPRIRVGIDRPIEEEELVDYVICKISNEEYNKIKVGIDRAVEAIEECINSGFDVAMNKYN